MAKLTFLGAAGSVTGSRYLVEAAGKRLLVDCGIFQGSQQLQDRNYKPLPVDLKTIDYLVLTHAHLDHTGWLPVLVKSGYRGPIFANPATIELTTILLKDSAHLQQEDTLHAIVHKDSRHGNPEPLYTPEDVDPTLKLIKSMPRSGSFDISPEFRVTSYDAGHILGSSSLELAITEGGKKNIVVFSGDIGRYNQAILKDPTTPTSNADVLICESTYGDREHPEGDSAEILAQIVNRVVKRGGSIVIPSFAIGRTQTFMYYLRQLEDQQRIPRLPVYVDSPMALDATDLYLKHKEDHDLEYVREEGSDGKGDPLNVHEFHLTRSVEESKAINNVKKPVASPGSAAARCAQCCDPRGIPGRGHARPRFARRRKIAQALRPGRAGGRRNRPDGTILCSRGKERVVALADGAAHASQADVSNPRRAGRGPGVAGRHLGKVSVESGGGALSRYRASG